MSNLLTIDDETPVTGQLLTASAAGLTDPDNVTPENPQGLVTGPISFTWQVELAPGSGVFQDIMVASPTGTVPATGASFTPGPAERGLALRVVAVYEDANGTVETVSSAATAPLANAAPAGTLSLSDATPTEAHTLFVNNAILDPDGTTGSVFSYQWQQSAVGGAGPFTSIGGATASEFTPGSDQVNRVLRVVVTYTDDGGTTEKMIATATAVTGDVIQGNNTAETLTGTDGQDIILGAGGNDTLNGLGEDDILEGGAGADVIRGGAGNDTINFTINGGVDVVDGGADFDALNVTGTTVDNVVAATWNGEALTSVAGVSITGVESVAIDLVEGTDTLNYSSSTASVVVDLGSGTASGFTSVTSVENATGSGGNDLLIGSAGVLNTLTGGAGNDTFVVHDSNDLVIEAANGGIDEVISKAAGYTITNANVENLRFDGVGNFNGIGNNAANVITGGDGDDALSGLAGNDTLRGGLGNDTLDGGAGNDGIDGGDGNDTIKYTAGEGADAVDGGAGDDALKITGDGSNNTLSVVFAAGALAQVAGGRLTSVETVTVDLDGGSDTLSYTDSTEAVRVDLAGSASGFTSIAGIDNAVGGSGNDLLISASGIANTLTGGAGDDVYVVHDASDIVVETSTGGIDEVRSVTNTRTLSANVENLSFAGEGNFTGTGNTGNNVITGGSGDDVLSGDAGSDTLRGAAGNDSLDGGTGDDSLEGGDGNDVLEGGVGIDTLDGGLGNDTLHGGAGAGDDVVRGGDGDDTINYAVGEGVDAVDGGAGNDRLSITGTSGNNTLNVVFAAGALTHVGGGAVTNVEAVAVDLDGGTDTLSYGASTEGVTVDLGGSAAGFNSIAGIDVVVGGSGNDLLTSAAGGTDTLNGGAGNDTFVVNDSTDVVLEAVDEGIDEVRSLASTYTLANANVENLSFTGTGTFTGTGNSGNNVITGGSGDDTLSGVGGNDTLLGGAGNDALDGGTGDDALDGGEGADSLLGGTGNDALQGSAGADALDGGNGDDNLDGGEGNDVLVGGVGNDALQGSAGADALDGGTGDDALDGGADDDLLEGGIGIDALDGGVGNDTLHGGAGDDVIRGGDGDDVINYAVGDGADVVDGGAGDDRLNITGTATNNTLSVVFSSGAPLRIAGGAVTNVEAIALDLDGGTDTLSYAANTEGVAVDLGGTASGFTSIAGIDIAVGGSGNDLLTSAAGITDTLNGGAGNDTFVVNDSTDVVVEAVDEGVDEVRSQVGSYTLANANVENLAFIGAGSFTGTGNSGDNVITGGSGDDLLSGAAGNDALEGGGGNDTLLGGVGNDALQGSAGADALDGGTGDDALEGGDDNDSLEGGTGNDALSGGLGNDSLHGGAGDDAIRGGDGDDVVSYAVGEGADAVDGGAGEDRLNITGSGANNTLNVVFAAGALMIAGGTVANVETISADLDGGTDTLSYAENTEGVRVDLAGTASGFSSLTAIENAVGGSGNDLLISAAGTANTLSGGAGDDTYEVHDETDIVVEAVDSGTDEVRAVVNTRTLSNNLENLTFVGAGNFTGTGNTGNNVITGAVGDDVLSGAAGDDVLHGGLGNDRLDGGTGNDTLDGGDGDDTVNYTVGQGADSVDGGAGQDRLNLTGNENANNLLVVVSGGVLTEVAGGTVANVETVMVDLQDGVDTLNYRGTTERVEVDLGAGTASGFTLLTGVENVTGGSGNDLLAGAAGVTNTLTGGDGDDTFVVHDSDDVVSEAPNGGTDEVRSYAATYAITDASVENLRFAGTGGFTGTGNSVANTITGGDGDDVLAGLGGNDTLVGGAGNDTLDGDGGDDVLYGGAGNDSLVAGGGNDTIIYNVGDGADGVNGGAGADRLSVLGSAAPDTLGVVFSGTTLSTVAGGSVVAVESVTADLDGGNDTLSYNGTTQSVSVNLGAGTASGFSFIAGVDNVVGGSGNDAISGDAGANTLQGGAGNDTFTYSVGGGADSIDGGAGQDRLNISGSAAADTLDVVFSGTALSQVAGGTIGGVEAVAADLDGGSDTLSYAGSTEAVTVNLAAGSASGFVSIVGIDNLVGGSGADALTGDAGANTFQGGAGNDTVQGGDGDDTVLYSLGQGADALDGGAGQDSLNIAGTAADDTLAVVFSGGALSPVAGGSVANVESVTADLLDGSDTLDYGGSTDSVSVNLQARSASGFSSIAGIENVTGGSGADVLTGDGGANVLAGGAGNDTLDGGAGNDSLAGGDGDDTVNHTLGDGADAVDGGTGQDSLNIAGTAAAETLAVVASGGVLTSVAGGAVANVETVRADLQQGVDTLDYSGTTESVAVNLALGSASGFVTIAGIENVVGGSGDDLLAGDAGANALAGGAGNDTFDYGLGNGADSVDGGAGQDRLNVAGTAAGETLAVMLSGGVVTNVAGVSVASVESVDADLGGGIDTLSYEGNTESVVVDVAAGNASGFHSATGVENAVGGSGNDLLTGDTGANVLAGGAGNDSLQGGAGDDILSGGDGNDTFNFTLGEGADTVDGGSGQDTLNVGGTAAAETLAVTFSGGVLTSLPGVTASNVEEVAANLQGGTDTLSYTGTTVDVKVDFSAGTASGFRSVAGIENAIGGSGNDTLAGSAGVVNALEGGAGNDTYVVHDTADIVVEGAAAGIDLVRSVANIYTLSDNVENLTFTGVGNFTGTGNAGANVITGGSGNDVLAGLAGNDTINGGGGTDTVNYTLGEGADSVDGGSGTDRLNFAGSTSGETLAVTLSAGVLKNIGSVSLVSVESVVADLQDGNDTLSYAGTAERIVVDLGSGSATGFTSIANIENVISGSGSDMLTGKAGVVNTLSGGTGNDTYVVHETDDEVVEGTGAGTDEVRSLATTYTLGANLENLTFTGAGNFTGTGNSLANVITGGSGNDVLVGLGGNDSINGGAGNDTVNYTMGDGADTVDGGAGTDTVNIAGSGAANTLAAVFAGGVLTSAAGVTLTRVESVVADLQDGIDTLSYAGNAAAVSVDLGAGTASGFTSIAGVENAIGGNGNDVLTDAAGVNNTLTGGSGNDTYVVHEAADEAVEASSGGTDEVRSYAQGYTLANVNVENLSFVGTGNFTGTGNSAANVLTGGAGDDLLSGLTGNDTLRGGDGNDTLRGGDGNDNVQGGVGNDTIEYAITEGVDTVDGGTGQDRLNVTGTSTANTLAVLFAGGLLTTVAGGAVTGVESVTADLQDGNDTLSYSASTAAVTVDLGAGTASGFTAIAGVENVVGGSGNDQLTGAAGVDNVLTGGGGNDTYTVHEASDLVVEAAGGGTDTIRSFAGNYTLAANVENLVFVGTGNLTVTGNAAANVLTGGAGDDVLAGLGGNDSISGGAGNDTVLYTIGDGADAVDGGTGNDRLVITGTTAGETLGVVFAGGVLTSVTGGTLASVETVSADLLGGSDTLSYAGSTAGVVVDLAAASASGFAAIAGIENVVGGSGNDLLSGVAGSANTLTGGAGNDTYVVHDQADVVVEASGGGMDEVRAVVNTRTLADNVENLTFIGVGNFAGTGNAGNNVITGGSGADVLAGVDGNDTLLGLAGNDTLTGGDGDDTINAGDGDDLVQYTVGEGADAVDGGSGADRLVIAGTSSGETLSVLYGGGALTSVAGGSVAGVESVVADLQGGWDTLSYAGSTADVTVDLGGSASGFASIAGIENVTGGSGNDLLISAAGVMNVMTGGAGNDIFVVHDLLDFALEASGGGTDEVRSYSGLYAILDSSVENLTFVGTGNFVGLGNSAANVITGGSGDDQLYGLGGNDTLVGGAGNDKLDGGNGDNTLNGGAGDDFIDGGAGNDILVFAPNFGHDKVDDFDAAPLGGQDRIDFRALGITAANFDLSVSISVGNIDGTGDLDTLVTVGTDTLALLGVNGVGENAITQADFLLS